uniref:Branchpoint-bridging protein n=1 Tax=Strigamia maritima TaxID=126957 RepID=T1JNQ7_STRMM
MATGANSTPLGRLNPGLAKPGPVPGGSLLKPSYMSSSTGIKREFGDDDSSLSPTLSDSSGSKKKRRSRWGGDEKDKTFIPGMPTVLPGNLSKDQEKAYLLQLQIEEISRRLRTGDLGIPPNPEERFELTQCQLVTHKLIRPPVVRVSDKVMIPQEEHPDINFVGLLIGPRGNTLKAMEKETGAKIIIRGKGSVKEGKVGRKDGQPLPGEDEPLHAYVTANNPESVKKAVEKIKEIIRQGVEVPEGQNDLRRMQLRELALLNGTLRENDGPRCSNCGAVTHKSWQCPDKPNVTNNVICTNCGGAGHIAKDCREKRPGNVFPGGNGVDKSKIDEEYMSLMAELGEGPPPPNKGSHGMPGVGPPIMSQGPPRPVMAPPGTGAPPSLQPPPPGASPQPASSPVSGAPAMHHWQAQTHPPGTMPYGGVPPPMLLQPPPPPPGSQPPGTMAMPWMQQQGEATYTTQQWTPQIHSNVDYFVSVGPPWQQPPVGGVPPPSPVPPPRPGMPMWQQSFMGVPPPPVQQPPLPGSVPPPPQQTQAGVSSSVVDLNALAQAGLPNLLAAPPPPPPS